MFVDNYGYWILGEVEVDVKGDFFGGDEEELVINLGEGERFVELEGVIGGGDGDRLGVEREGEGDVIFGECESFFCDLGGEVFVFLREEDRKRDDEDNKEN